MMECLPTIRKLDCSATNMLLLTVCTPKKMAMVPDDIIISDPDEKRRDEMSLLGRQYCK